jgi:Cu/Zn superoxide dismutase
MKGKRIMALTVAVASLAIVAVAAAAGKREAAGSVKLRAVLTANNSAVSPDATGVFTATLQKASRRLTWRLTYSGLSGEITGAHIHKGKPPTESLTQGTFLCPRPRGPICPSGAHGTETLLPWMATAMLKGNSFVNVHTQRFVSGEIGGIVKKVG